MQFDSFVIPLLKQKQAND